MKTVFEIVAPFYAYIYNIYFVAYVENYFAISLCTVTRKNKFMAQLEWSSPN